jgi:hypothetical protein
MVFAIDPGLRHCGFAKFTDSGILVDARLVKSSNNEMRGPPAWLAMADAVSAFIGDPSLTRLLVIEVPRIYPHSRDQKGDLNDLLELAGVVGAIAARARVIQFVYPSEWKGQLPKKVMNERVLKALDVKTEGGALVHHDHNTLDAVGIGLHYFGRIGKKRVFR